MKELEERIRRDGIIKDGGVLKVDAFLNHQCDVELFDAMGAEWAQRFKGVPVNKILTIEASGIGIACVAARHFGDVPVVFAKKAQSILMASSAQHRSTPSPSSASFPLSWGSASSGLMTMCSFSMTFLPTARHSRACLKSASSRGPRCRALASRSRRRFRAGETACAPAATVSNRSRAWGRWMPVRER